MSKCKWQGERHISSEKVNLACLIDEDDLWWEECDYVGKEETCPHNLNKKPEVVND